MSSTPDPIMQAQLTHFAESVLRATAGNRCYVLRHDDDGEGMMAVSGHWHDIPDAEVAAQIMLDLLRNAGAISNGRFDIAIRQKGADEWHTLGEVKLTTQEWRNE